MITPGAASRPADDHCEDIRQQVFAACDGELSAEALVAIDAHLQRCAACHARYEADAVFHRVVRAAVGLDAAPQSLRDRVALLLHARTTENAPA